VTERVVVFDCCGESLVGILHEPDATRHDLAVLVVVGGPQYRVGSHRQFVLMSRMLSDVGYPVLRFDHRGMGDSTGLQRSFDSVDDDIRAAIDALSAEIRGLRGMVIFGLCDAASAALIYGCSDPRVVGLVLANPWVRTDVGRARTQVRHYYGQRLLTGSFWRKVMSGKFNPLDSLDSFVRAVLRAFGGAARIASDRPGTYIDQMLIGLAGYVRMGRPVLLLMSESDLTAREFDDLCHSSSAWREQISATNVSRVDLPEADHTFSSAKSLETATAAVLAWLTQYVATGLSPR